MAELSDVVFRQQQEIHALKAQIEQLRDRLEAAHGPDGSAGAEQGKPPHY